MENNSLAIFTKASEMLAEANTIQKAKELKDLALTAKEWAKRKDMGEEAIKHCHSYSVRAEIRLGEMLLATERAKGAKGIGKKVQSTAVTALPTLDELGITKREASQSQQLAKMSEEKKEAVVKMEKTRAQVSREVKEKKREAKRQENRIKIERCGEVVGLFSTILIDPPWSWGDEGDINQLGRARPDYHTLPYDELLVYPVTKYADSDCHIYCWVTNRSMPKVFSLLIRWGFRYIALLTWPKPSFGMGNYFRGQTEHIAFGVKGSQLLKRKDASTLLPTWPRGKQHSSKPLEIYEFVESCSPGPYLEIFGRNKRDGWTVIGEDGING